MSAHTPGPWACLDDKSMGNEHHYQVVNSDGAPLFDSINRSPAADDATERADMVMAAAATEMFAALATDTGVDVDVQAVQDRVKKEHAAEIRARNKVQAEKARAEEKTPDTPLNPAAQAGGVRGGGKLKKTERPAAPKRPRTTPEEALQGIAAAMQGEGGGGGDCAPLGSDPDGASAVGQEGRATAPDAGADQAIAPGARVVPYVAWPFPKAGGRP